MSNVVPLFNKKANRKLQESEDIAEVIIDLAERHGVDMSDPYLKVRLADVVTHLQVIIRDSDKV